MAPNPVNKPGSRWQAAWGVLARPGPTFAALAADPRPRWALSYGLLLGLGWALFAAGLAAQGHQPSMTRGLPVAPERYYGVAALYLAPLWVGLTLLTAGVAHGMARILGGRGAWPASLSAVGPAYALPLLTLWLVPDVLTWLIAGHGALGMTLRVAAPVAVVGVTVRTVQAIRAAHGLGVGRALAAALVAALAQAAPFGWLVR